MRKFALAMAAVAAVAFTAPAFAQTAPAPQRMAQADVKVKVKSGERGHMRKKVVVRHDRGLHRGWSHSRHYGANKKVVVVKKKGPGKTVIKKKITHG